MNEIVERILAKMKEQGLDQKTLAARIGVRQPTVTEWKKGVTSSYTKYMPQLAEVLQTDIDYLMFGTQKSAVRSSEELVADELVSVYMRLRPEDRPRVLSYMQGLIDAHTHPASPDMSDH